MAFGEFVCLIGACMALNAVSIDIMLPALPQLSSEFGLANTNLAQYVVAAFLIGTGISMLFYGPLADRFGRKPVIIVGLVLFIFAGILTTVADSFPALLVARVLQGVGAGAPRVLAISVARDRYAGAQMARVMSFATMVFMVGPVLAPSFGYVILQTAPSWRWVFGTLAVLGGALLLWVMLRLPETLSPDNRLTLTVRAVYSAYRQTWTNRRCAGYMLALSLVVGAHMGFIFSSKQIFDVVFQSEKLYPILFAAIALMTGAAAFANSKLVRRVGMRRLAVAGLQGIIVINIFHLGLDFAGHESLPVFMLLQGASVFTFGLLAANLNAMVMEPMGHIAGTASSMVNFFSTIVSTVVGLLIGQMFNGSVIPLNLAYVVLAVASLVIAYYTEKPPQYASSDLPPPSGE
jgi:DHA1 family bicyclomycin/chloramphenicol resistance-like MFS transporter